jgi:hypothetical protein
MIENISNNQAAPMISNPAVLMTIPHKKSDQPFMKKKTCPKK